MGIFVEFAKRATLNVLKVYKMPAKLPEDLTKITWRVQTEDLDLLEGLYGRGNVNKVIRELLSQYCNSLRAKGFARVE